MSATDPRPAVPRCACRHTVTKHRVNGKGQRAGCTAGSCDCRVYVWAKAAES